MIELNKISVTYGDNVIYDNFGFCFEEGVNVVLGASGSGKTTLLNVISGLTDFKGVCKTDPVAMVFQNPCLAPTTALNNVVAVLDRKDSVHKAEQMLELCHIGDKARQRADRLSGGEQQRISLARAFAVNRPVLLMDEPFNSLDFGVKRKLYSILDELLVCYRKTVVLVTHDVDEAICLADRIYLLSGRPAILQQVEQIDLPRAQRNEYSSELLALRRTLQNMWL